MNRRDAIFYPLALGASSHAAAQQAGRVYRIGFVRPGQPPSSFITAFQQGLRELGYVDGKNIFTEYRLKEASPAELMRTIEELVALKVDLILASGAPPAVAAQKITKSLPVVFVGVNGPLELGLVSSLARPGGNLTGLAMTSADLAGKRLDLLRVIVPGIKRLAVLWRPENPGNQIQMKGVEAAAPVFKVQLQPIAISTPDDFDSAFNSARGADALFVIDDPLFVAHRIRIAQLATSSRLPAMYGYREMMEPDGMMSYGVALSDLYRRSATYVDKIFRGSKPADLPVEQPLKFELLLNLKVTRALGLTVPQSLLLLADEVIQ